MLKRDGDRPIRLRQPHAADSLVDWELPDVVEIAAVSASANRVTF